MEFKYKINKLSEGKNFEPSLIPTNIPDVVEIVGIGSIGKTTFANMISCGSHGNDNEKIHYTLQRKLRLFMNPRYQELTFRFQLKSANGDTIIISEKKDPTNPEIKITKYVDDIDNDLSRVEDFEKEIVLIHVTPIGPNNIIRPMIQRVEQGQLIITRKLKTFVSYLQKAIDQTNNTRIERITELKKENVSYKEQSKNLSEKMKFYDDKLRLLMSVVSREGLTDCEGKIKKISSDIKRVEKEIGGKGNDISSSIKNYDTTQKEFKEKLINLESQFDIITNQLVALLEDRNRLESWEKISFDKVEVELKFDSNFRSLINQFQLDIDKMKNDNRHSLTEIKYYQKLRLDSVNVVNLIDVKIPGTDLTISKFIDAINKALKEHEKLIRNKDIMEDCDNNLRGLKNKLKDLEELLQKYKKLQDMNDRKNNLKDTVDIEEKKEELSKLKDNMADCKKDQEIYSQLMDTGRNRYKNFGNEKCKIGENDLMEYKDTGLKGLLKNIENLQDTYFGLKNSLENIEDLKNRNDVEIKNLEDQIPSQWEGYYEELNNLLQAARSVTTISDEMNRYIDNIDDFNDEKQEIVDQEQLHYCDTLFSCFAKIKPILVHNRKEYEVIRIDLNGFTSKDGVRIDFNDMGGSEGQTAFLDYELNLPDDGRKIILVCDEVGNMDVIGLENLREQMRRLRNENRLLFGVIIRAENQTEKINEPPEIFDIMSGNKI